MEHLSNSIGDHWHDLAGQTHYSSNYFFDGFTTGYFLALMAVAGLFLAIGVATGRLTPTKLLAVLAGSGTLILCGWGLAIGAFLKNTEWHRGIVSTWMVVTASWLLTVAFVAGTTRIFRTRKASHDTNGTGSNVESIMHELVAETTTPPPPLSRQEREIDDPTPGPDPMPYRTDDPEPITPPALPAAEDVAVVVDLPPLHQEWAPPAPALPADVEDSRDVTSEIHLGDSDTVITYRGEEAAALDTNGKKKGKRKVSR